MNYDYIACRLAQGLLLVALGLGMYDMILYTLS